MTNTSTGARPPFASVADPSTITRASLPAGALANVIKATVSMTQYSDGPEYLDIYGLVYGTVGDASPTTTGSAETSAPANTTGPVTPGSNTFTTTGSGTTNRATLLLTTPTAPTVGQTDNFSGSTITPFVKSDTNGLVTFMFTPTYYPTGGSWY